MTRPAGVITGPEIAQDWHDARQLLADAGMGDMTVAAAVAVLLPPPADEDELAASIARHPSSRRRGHTITWTIDDLGYVEGAVTCHESLDADCQRETAPECNYILWVENADGWLEHHDGRRTALRDGAIEFRFDGSGYTWRYADGGSAT